MLNILTIIISVSFLFFIGFVANSKETPKKNSDNKNIFSKEFTGRAKVIDGDSILVGEKEVRLFGIDAPEYKQTCLDQDDAEYNCGKKSFYFLKKLVNKKQVRCEYHKKDIYDRYLAKCYLGQLSLNESLLENGMAVIYNYYNSTKELKALEKIAKENKKGIWQGAFELPRHYRKRNKRK